MNLNQISLCYGPIIINLLLIICSNFSVITFHVSELHVLLLIIIIIG